MLPPADTTRYKNHRFPSAIISHGVWLSYRYTMRYRDVAEFLCVRGSHRVPHRHPHMASEV
jgi:transposase-like protein